MEETIEDKARKLADMGDDWHPWYFERIEGGCLIKGAICPYITRGKRKGQPNYKKADKKTEKTVFLPDSD